MVPAYLASTLAGVSLSASLALGGGPAPVRPIRPQLGRPAPTQPDAGFRATVLHSVVGRTGIAHLTRRSPVLGGRWYVGSPHDVRFLDGNRLAIDYEDGHVAGRLIVQVGDPGDVRTWQVLKDEAQ